ncbi:hypothetical protein Patl1_29204 [Pistacia atlantica]|uniref:Uncharacterized protein n=1 Tax=Pistacia atlantica TaxID=434234 RepID=A0ACC1BDG1_9ROSI|nr:hypothetical protein Patl1_29204 [Pistacia atlantica]
MILCWWMKIIGLAIGIFALLAKGPASFIACAARLLYAGAIYMMLGLQ